jgi:hypothetical protein
MPPHASRATTIPSWPNRSRTLAALSVRLRSEIDLDSLFAELLAVVDQTMQPTRASLRPRPSAHPWPPSDETDIRRGRRSPAPELEFDLPGVGRIAADCAPPVVHDQQDDHRHQQAKHDTP